MKKAILILIMAFGLGYTSQAQLDTAKTMRDTTMLDHNKKNNNRNQDSLNREKKMPPKNETGNLRNRGETLPGSDQQAEAIKERFTGGFQIVDLSDTKINYNQDPLSLTSNNNFY